MNEKKITGAIFDMDGVLLDSMHVWNDAGERFLRKQGIAAEADLGRKLFTMTMEDGADYLIEKYGLDMKRDEVISGIDGMIYDFYAEEVELKPGVRELLEHLRRAGIPMVIATSTDRIPAEKAMERTGIGGYFKGIFTCAETGAGKDKPDIYLAAGKCIGTDTESTYVFEDGLHGIRTAHEAGFVTVGIYDPASEKDQKQIRQIADIYFSGPVDPDSII